VDAAEIVLAHVKSNSSFQVVEFLAIRIGQTGETAQVHTKTQIRPGHPHAVQAELVLVCEIMYLHTA
jgi:hypothetical protein